MIKKLNSVKGQIGIYTFLDFSPKFVSFITLPLFLRIILPKYWGQIAILLIIQQIYVVIIRHGTSAELLIIPEEVRNNLRYHLKIFAEMIAISIFLLVFQNFLFNMNFLNFEYKINSLNWVLLSALFVTMSRHIRVTLNLQNKMMPFVILSILNLIFVPSFQVIYVLREIFKVGFSSSGTVSAYMIGYCLGLLMSFFPYVPSFLLSLNNEKYKKEKRYNNLKTAIVLQSLFIFLVSFQDRFLIEFYLESTDVAIYSAYDSIARLAKLLPQGLITFTTISFFGNKKSNFYENSFFNTLKISSYIVLIICLSKYVFLDFLFPEIYTQNKIILTLLTISSWIWAVSNLITINLISKEKNFVFIISSSTAFILNLLLNIYLIPIYGILGSAISTLIAVVIMFGIKLYNFDKVNEYFINLKFFKDILLPVVFMLVLDLFINRQIILFISIILLFVYSYSFIKLLKKIADYE